MLFNIINLYLIYLASYELCLQTDTIVRNGKELFKNNEMKIRKFWIFLCFYLFGKVWVIYFVKIKD